MRRKESRPHWPSLLWTAGLSAAGAVLITRNFFEVEKKIRHLITMGYGPEDARFRRTMSQLLGPPLVEGNSVTALQNGAQIFPAMLAAIQKAKRSICFENFIFREGHVGRSASRTPTSFPTISASRRWWRRAGAV